MCVLMFYALESIFEAEASMCRHGYQNADGLDRANRPRLARHSINQKKRKLRRLARDLGAQGGGWRLAIGEQGRYR
jgi:hypothetical protein